MVKVKNQFLIRSFKMVHKVCLANLMDLKKLYRLNMELDHGLGQLALEAEAGKL